MSVADFQCEKCGSIKEISWNIQNKTPKVICKKCGKPMKRVWKFLDYIWNCSGSTRSK